MLEDALKYPFNGEDKLRTYAIGTLLAISSIFIIPAFFLLGYYVKVMRQTIDGTKDIPAFEDFGKLFVDGLRFTGILVVYIVISIILLSGITALGVEIGAPGVFGLISLILFSLVIYIIPSAVANFAKDDSFKSAFSKKAVKDALTLRYFIAMLLIFFAWLIILIVKFIVLIVLVISIIGIPLILIALPAFNFFERLIYHRLAAKAIE